MCLMAPMRVMSLDGTSCEVDSGGRIERVSMVLEPDLEVGDWVLVNGGTVVRRLDPDQAEEMSLAIEVLFGPAEVEPPVSLAPLTS
jgi:hydrogenase assembly chaperone HypC/HupF